MLTNPPPGTIVQVWYRAAFRHLPLHGRVGTIIVRGKGRKVGDLRAPTNHGIEIDGKMYVVNCGHLRKPR